MSLYKKTYRVETTRLQNYDYRKTGKYFVTICTKKKMQWFGEVKNGEMMRNELGEIVRSEWMKTPILRPYVALDAWCIMPNHFHGILIIKHHVETPRGGVSLLRLSTESAGTLNTGSGDMLNIESAALNTETRAPHVSTSLASKSLGEIINQFKGAATKRIRNGGHTDFQWQPRYYDRVIRSEKELAAIREYIAQNPDRWDKETIPWHADSTFWNV